MFCTASAIGADESTKGIPPLVRESRTESKALDVWCVLNKPPDLEQRYEFADYAAETVTVKGKLVERDGISMTANAQIVPEDKEKHKDDH